MLKILIAGGSGFIGSHLVERVLSEGNSVVVLDNFITGDKKNIEPFLSNPNFSFIEHDVIRPLPENEKLSNVSIVLHLASPASPNKKSPHSYINHPIETLLVNSVGTYNLLEFVKKMNAKLIFASSSEIYGDPNVSPQTESYFGHVNPNGVRSVYDEGKRFGESMTMTYVRKYNLNAVILRIFNTYGPRMQKDDGRVVSNFIIQALSGSPITVYGDGAQTRSFCYVSDLVDGLVLCLQKDNLSGEVINLGNPDEHTVLEIAKMIKEQTQSSSEIVFEELPEDDPTKRRPDMARAQKLLEFQPKVDLVTGLAKTIEYFRSI